MKGLKASEGPIVPRGLKVPSPWAERMAGLERRALSSPLGVTGFGVARTLLPAGAISGLHHRHSRRDEFVFVLTGELVAVGDDGEAVLSAGMCAGFPAGSAHHLENRSDAEAIYLDISSLAEGDEIELLEQGLRLTGAQS